MAALVLNLIGGLWAGGGCLSFITFLALNL